MTIPKCPCKECILVAKCRLKSYGHLFFDCSLLRIYEPKYQLMTERDSYHLYQIEKHINPVIWTYRFDSTLHKTFIMDREEEGLND